MALSVIILAGARDSGKSDTLKTVIKDKLHEKWAGRRVIYPFKGKSLCIYTSSPQEQMSVGFCNFRKVNRIIQKRVDGADSNNCSLLIMPFTLATNRWCELNASCITKPLDRLKKPRVMKLRLLYLWKVPCRGFKLMDDLMMKQLRAQRIKSMKGKKAVRRQANRLWKVVMQTDP